MYFKEVFSNQDPGDAILNMIKEHKNQVVETRRAKKKSESDELYPLFCVITLFILKKTIHLNTLMQILFFFDFTDHTYNASNHIYYSNSDDDDNDENNGKSNLFENRNAQVVLEREKQNREKLHDVIY